MRKNGKQLCEDSLYYAYLQRGGKLSKRTFLQKREKLFKAIGEADKLIPVIRDLSSELSIPSPV